MPTFRSASPTDADRCHEVEMSDEDFEELVGHDSDAPNVVILSVAVDPSHQGKWLSRAMMDEVVLRMRGMGRTAIPLMCRDHQVPLYERLGHRHLRPSASDHGGMTWHEMSVAL